jgi:hypothetical protein
MQTRFVQSYNSDLRAWLRSEFLYPAPLACLFAFIQQLFDTKRVDHRLWRDTLGHTRGDDLQTVCTESSYLTRKKTRQKTRTLSRWLLYPRG